MSSLYVYDGFSVQLLTWFHHFYVQAFLNCLNLVGIQNSELRFLVNSGVRAFMIPIDGSVPLILWVINSKWVRYWSQYGYLGWTGCLLGLLTA